MSDVSVDIIKNRSGEAPDLPSGANLSGVSTAATLQVTNLNPTHINASGVTTATTFSGSFKSTSTPTLGLGVTINSSGINISGVATAGIVSATTLFGDGSNLTGVAMSIAPISYNPDVNDTQVGKTTGIGITFTERIIAGSGNVTLSVANAGAAGTVVENFGVGNSVTINQNKITIDPTSNLTIGETYHISYPSGAFTNTGGDVSYVGTAYTFGAKPVFGGLYAFGLNDQGQLGQNSNVKYSSPVQIPGTRWTDAKGCPDSNRTWIIGTNDGTLWTVATNGSGQLGQNNRTAHSSPVQVPGTTWSGVVGTAQHAVMATKTDGTLWAWGSNTYGQLGQNENGNRYSSPVQIPGTNWVTDNVNGIASAWDAFALKTDGTLWTWGKGFAGSPGTNQPQNVHRSSPTQIPGTTWNNVWAKGYNGNTCQVFATKTDGTTWAWGPQTEGDLGLNSLTQYSSPVQLPGNWSYVASNASAMCSHGIRTDGTLWAWGTNGSGTLGLNQPANTKYSSPVQVGSGTDWKQTEGHWYGTQLAVKTDGTLWAWGRSQEGSLGLNQGGPTVRYSSPVQVPGTTWSRVRASTATTYAFVET